MAYRLIGQDSAVQLSLTAAAHVGGTPTYGAAVDLKPATGRARRISIDDSLSTTDVSALGDTRDKVRGKRGSTKVEVEMLVLDAGHMLLTAVGGATKLGYGAKLEIKPLSSLTPYQIWTGLITEWHCEIPDGEQVERFVITCDAD